MQEGLDELQYKLALEFGMWSHYGQQSCGQSGSKTNSPISLSYGRPPVQAQLRKSHVPREQVSNS